MAANLDEDDTQLVQAQPKKHLKSEKEQKNMTMCQKLQNNAATCLKITQIFASKTLSNMII